MTQVDKEKILDKYSIPVTIGGTEIILNQMKYSICKIENKNGKGTGFFCKISNKKLLITNNHVINEEIIKNNNVITVKLNDGKIKKDIKIKDYYTSIDYDTTIIEININDEKINYLEIDDNIFDDNINIYNESIYIIQYPKYVDGQKGAVSYGILNRISDEYNLIYYCSTDHGSSGSPILNLLNKKIIGIHKQSSINYNYNIGTLLKYPIKEYLNKNEIKLIIKTEKADINNDINFLDNSDMLFEDNHNKLKELNELNTEIFIDNKKFKYIKSFKPEKEGLYEIKIKFKNIKIKDCSYMFYNCSKLTNIDLSFFDSKDVTNMSNMFFGCSNLTNIDLTSFDTKNVTDMSYMFFYCSKLTNLDLSSFDTKNVTDMSEMFYNCFNLKNINLSSFDTKNVTEMSEMFYNCSNLKNINLSSFDTKNVTDTSFMFSNCSNLNFVKINNFSYKIIKELSFNTNITYQFENNISKDNNGIKNNLNHFNNNMNNNIINNSMNNTDINMKNNLINNICNNYNNNMISTMDNLNINYNLN